MISADTALRHLRDDYTRASVAVEDARLAMLSELPRHMPAEAFAAIDRYAEALARKILARDKHDAFGSPQ